MALQNPVYAPAMRVITNITNANPAVVTTSFNHGYITGTIARIDMPIGYGMPQIDQQTGTIAVLSPTTFSISIDTTTYEPYSTPQIVTQYPQVVPFAEINEILTAAVQNILTNNT